MGLFHVRADIFDGSCLSGWRRVINSSPIIPSKFYYSYRRHWYNVSLLLENCLHINWDLFLEPVPLRNNCVGTVRDRCCTIVLEKTARTGCVYVISVCKVGDCMDFFYALRLRSDLSRFSTCTVGHVGHIASIDISIERLLCDGWFDQVLVMSLAVVWKSGRVSEWFSVVFFALPLQGAVIVT